MRETSDKAKMWLQEAASAHQRPLEEAIKVAELVGCVGAVLGHQKPEADTGFAVHLDNIRFSESDQRRLPTALRELASIISISSWPQKADCADQIPGFEYTVQRLAENLQRKAHLAADRASDERRLAAFVVDLLTSDSSCRSEEMERTRPPLDELAADQRLAANTLRLAAQAIDAAQRQSADPITELI